VEYLKRNVAANNVQGRVIPILGDAEKIIRDRLQGIADRVIMNLPEKAIRYVKAACEAVKPEGGIIHYYEFSQEAESHEDIKSRLSGILNQAGRKVEGFLSVRAVREVAPYRWQMAVDIKIR
jgi:tRNA G37 N-methylase Trm5